VATQDGGAAFLEGMALVCSQQGVFVARVGLDGRLGILHNIPKPPEAREDCLPYATWRLRSSALPNADATTP
jgi:hypothetical protein